METHFYADLFYNWFNQNLNGRALDEYYQLDSMKVDLERLDVYKFQLTCIKKVQYVPPNITKLPLELLRHISSFVTYSDRRVLAFVCTNDYPFAPPIWELSERREDMVEPVLLHNYENSVPGNWCMQCMEADILQMLLRFY
jgi:hypothetical protein